ncbi:MAG: cytochrome ubiquinol oxidase subunit, partial [Rhodospirillales bacterium]|nr:cytochrome ubiquinol oxidase subunit [Rhodospirillales bacterium]
QPWLVTGILTTAEAVGPVPASGVATTLAMYLVLYAGLLLAFILAIFRLAKKGKLAEATSDSVMPITTAVPQQP